jgi:hypothetical protein
MDGADGFGIRISGIGLRPSTPSSLDPSGMPVRRTADVEAIRVGDEADAAG